MSRKLFILLLLSISINSLIFAQVLRNVSVNLNSGGYINEVVYIPDMDAHLVVGNFTSIQGVNRKNMAFLSASTLQVLSNFNYNMNAEIRSIVYQKILVSGSPHHYFIFGGDFTQFGLGANPPNSEGLGLIYVSGNINQFSASTAPNLPGFQQLAVFNWNYAVLDNAFGGVPFESFGVHALHVSNDTLYVGGRIQGVNLINGTQGNLVGSSVTNSSFFALRMDPLTSSKFTLINSSVNNNPIVSSIGSMTQSAVYSILSTQSHVILGLGSHFPGTIAGPRGLQRRTKNHSTILNITPITTDRLATQIVPFSENGFLSYHKSASAAWAYSSSKVALSSGSTNYFFPVNNSNTGYYERHIGHTSYNGDIFNLHGRTSPARVALRRHEITGASLLVNTEYMEISPIGSEQLILSSVWENYKNTDVQLLQNALQTSGRHLFVSSSAMTQASGQSRTGLAVYCLEPHDAKVMTTVTFEVCPGETNPYIIEPVPFATGYRWSYTGIGVQYSLNNVTFQNFTTPILLPNTTVYIRFTQNATSGDLIVEPYNTCNTSNDYLYSRPISTSITIKDFPQISLDSDSLVLNCIINQVELSVSVEPINSDVQWYSFVGGPSLSSMTQFTLNSIDVLNPINYYCIVTHPVSFCSQIDTVFVGLDYALPIFNSSSFTINPPVFNCLTNSVSMNYDVGPLDVFWTAPSAPNIQLPNPLEVFNPFQNQYNVHLISPVNGCQTTQQLGFEIDLTTISSVVQNYVGFPLPLDSLSCANPELLLTAMVDPSDVNAAFGTVFWELTDNSAPQSIEVDSSWFEGNILLVNVISLNNNNGCTDTSTVVLIKDFTIPFVAQLLDIPELNCSVDTTTMIHPLAGNTTYQESWLDEIGTPINSLSQFIDGPGWFVFQVIDSQNGCVNYDSIFVDQNNNMFLELIEDTLVCPNQEFQITASGINIDENIVFTWSNGTVGNSTIGIGAAEAYLSVSGLSESGCVGADTVWILITEPIETTISGYAACGASLGVIQIDDVIGGAGNYTYAFDGASFDEEPFFEDLTFQDYIISIQDDLGCVYNFEFELTQEINSPPLDFLVATYSSYLDTLVVVNTTLYGGIDSVDWIFPENVIVYEISNELVKVQFADTGWYQITMISFEDTCSYSFTKWVYIGEFAPSYDIDFEDIKIQSTLVYPNPTTGIFQVEVVFGVSQNYVLTITNELGQTIPGMKIIGQGQDVNHTMSFPVGAQSGSYLLHIIADFDAQRINIIKQ